MVPSAAKPYVNLNQTSLGHRASSLPKTRPLQTQGFAPDFDFRLASTVYSHASARCLPGIASLLKPPTHLYTIQVTALLDVPRVC